jgi:hypothetical protein
MFVHVSFQTDGSGQDGFGGTGLETSSWIVSHAKMVAHQLSQIKRVIHSQFNMISRLGQHANITVRLALPQKSFVIAAMFR